MTAGAGPAERAVPPVLEDPVRGAYLDPALLGVPGAELIEWYVDGRVELAPISHLTGMRPAEAGGGECVFTMPAHDWLLSARGDVHGGALSILADGPLTTAVSMTLPPGRGLATAELSMNFVAPARAGDGELTARARMLGPHERFPLSDVAVVDGRGRLVAHGTTRCRTFTLVLDPPEPPPRPAPVAPSHDGPDPYLRPGAGAVVPRDVWASTPGLDVVRAQAAGELPAAPVYRLMGVTVAGVAPGEVALEMPASEWLCSPSPQVQGGALAFLAHAAAEDALTTTAAPGEIPSVLDVKVVYLRPVAPDRRPVTARARVVHRGRSFAVATAETTTAEGELAGAATVTAAITGARGSP